jgi:hypothetical protein
MHNRSFSNDRDTAMSLELRRHRRSTAGSQSRWDPTLPLDPLDDLDAIVDARRRDAEIASSKPVSGPPANGQVTWMSLPRKDQLCILFISRLVDFLQVASLQAYVFYQLKDINNTLTDSQISQQAGILQGCFTGAQVCTAILWGKAADAPWCGRKWVLFIGMAGTAVSCLGYGFATTFFWAAFWRMFGGAINGTVGIM